MKVLVVDDVGLICRRLEQLLVDHGYAVETADAANSALEILGSDHTIAAVLTDLHMPGHSGFDLFQAASQIERIGDDGAAAAPPAFILMTASGLNSNAPGQNAKLLEYAIDLGFVDVLPKPMDNNRLLSLLEAIDNNLNTERPIGDQESVTVSLSDEVERALETISDATDDLFASADIETLFKLQDKLGGCLGRLEAGLESVACELTGA